MAVEKAQGLKKGQTVRRIGEIEVLSVRRERLDSITADEVLREGVDAADPLEFVKLFCAANGCRPDAEVTRIVVVPVALARGRVWCTRCARSQAVDTAACFRMGWPKCCGLTMTIDSPEERR